MEEHLLALLAQYGYFAIFALLVLGIAGLPVPDETLLTVTGVLAQSGHLSLPLAYLVAFSGSACGITLSYVLGRAFGIKLIHRYGKYVGIRDEHLAKAHGWFERAGHWSLTFGYFIPGVRHFTAYAAGMSDLEFPKFMVFAYSGAALWSATFIGLGYFLGERWKTVLESIHHYLLQLTIAAVVLAAVYLVWRKRRRPAKP